MLTEDLSKNSTKFAKTSQKNSSFKILWATLIVVSFDSASMVGPLLSFIRPWGDSREPGLVHVLDESRSYWLHPKHHYNIKEETAS